jgi:hypothetical protein
MTNVGNQAKPVKYSEKKKVFYTNLEQMFKRTTKGLDTQPTTQQRLTVTQNCQAAAAAAAASTIWAIRSYSESTSHRHLQRPLDWTGVAWPPRSPDLTPKDFFLWGHINILKPTGYVMHQQV